MAEAIYKINGGIIRTVMIDWTENINTIRSADMRVH